MRRIRLAALLALLALLLSGCRFMVVESDSLRVSTPTATPGAGEDAVETQN